MNEVTQLIEQNNELRKQLNDENMVYYEDLLVYFRLKGWLIEDRLIEETLLMILQDILTAQQENETAEDYFGRSPKEHADALLNALPKASIKQISSFIGLTFGILTFFSFIGQFTTGINRFSLAILVSNAIISACGVAGLLWFIQTMIYTKVPKWLSTLLVAIGSACLFGGFLFSQFYLRTTWEIALPHAFIITAFSIILVGLTIYLLIKLSKHEYQSILLGVSPFLYVNGLVSIYNQFAALSFSSFMNTTLQLLLILASAGVSYFLLFRFSK